MTLAVAKVANLLIEGAHDVATLPEVHSEAAEAGHLLLGCDLWSAMVLMSDMVHTARDSGAPEKVIDYLDGIFKDHITHHAAHVVSNRGPIGEHYCEGN